MHNVCAYTQKWRGVPLIVLMTQVAVYTFSINACACKCLIVYNIRNYSVLYVHVHVFMEGVHYNSYIQVYILFI